MKHQRKRVKSSKTLAKSEAVAAPKGDPDHREGTRRRVVLAGDPAGHSHAVKDAYVNVMGAAVLGVQTRNYIHDDGGTTAETFLASLRESVQPRDAVEEMLLVELAWTHARIATLSVMAVQQTQTVNVRVLNEACDRAANTFRRLMLALADYRRPRPAPSFVAIRQANLANQQVIHNAQETEFENGPASNEQGSAPALPLVTERPEFPAGGRAKEQALAAQHRPQDRGGQGQLEAERAEAWRALRQGHSGEAGAQPHAEGDESGTHPTMRND